MESVLRDGFVEAEDVALFEPEVGAASFDLYFDEFQVFVDLADCFAFCVLDGFQLPIVTGPFIICLLVSKLVNKVGKKMVRQPFRWAYPLCGELQRVNTNSNRLTRNAKQIGKRLHDILLL